MSIEIKEITIKASVYPTRENTSENLPIPERELERLKRDIIKAVTKAVIEQINHTQER